MAKKSMMNLSLDAEVFEALKKQSEIKGVKLSEYIADWINKLGLEKSDVKRVVFQIPPNAFESRAALESWLFHRSREVVSHYFKE